MSPTAAELAAVGATVQLAALVLDQNGQAMMGPVASWSSGAIPVATVDGNGLVTAVANGTTTITASAGSATGTATVTVAQTVSTVAVSPGADTLVAGDTLQLSAAARDANGHPVADAEFTWASSDTALAVVEETGLVSGVGEGEVSVTATSAGVVGRAELVVLAPAPATVVIIPDTVVLGALSDTVRLTAEVKDQLDRVMEGEQVLWATGDTVVATVDSVGLVTATGNGTTSIIATAGAASGTATVAVVQSTSLIVVSPPADTIGPGDTVRLVAEAYDENGHIVLGAQFIWSSSNRSVAEVDGTGLVRGVAVGRATITATTGNARGTSDVTVANPDRAALVALYEATDGRNWANSENWLTDAPLGDWYGVRTDGTGRVVRLDLRGSPDGIPHGLSGPIPPQLGRLTSLILLDLATNKLSGPIPPELGNLTNLVWLDLSNNNLSRAIPSELGSLPNLQRLLLGRNVLSGSIPSELGDLASLRQLSMAHNVLSGPIPPELGALDSLRMVSLSNNDLEGPIPPELASLLSLAALDIAFNGLEGPIPPELGALVNLGVMNLSNNDLQGSIPPGFDNLANLKWLYLGSNELGGPIPPELGNLANLNSLLLAGNELKGAIPPELGNLSRLSTLWLGDNRLTGRIPPELGNLANLDALLAFENRLTGTIPPELGNLSRLSALWLSDNRLAGRIPPELGNLASLDTLLLANNSLTGLPPSGFPNTLVLSYLDLSDNPLEMPQAINFRGLAHLELLILRETGLTDLPSGVFSHLEELRSLDLRDNRFVDLPLGAFLGIKSLSDLRLEGNPGAPFSLTLEPERTDTHDLQAPGPASVGVTLKQGAPFNLVLPLSVHGGAISERRVVLEAGSDKSAEVQVTRDDAGRSGTQVAVGPAPNLPFRYGGIELRVADPLVLFGTVSNHAPVAARTSPLSRLRVGGEPLSFDVSSYFRDPDGDELEYSAVSESPDVVSVSVSGDQVTLGPVGPGATNVTVTATDPEGLSARSSLPASVRGSSPGLFDIDLILIDEVSASIQVAFEDAVDYWSLILAGTELPDVPLGEDFHLACGLIGTPKTMSSVDDLVIISSVREIDGRGRILASAGWCGIRDGEAGLPFMGAMQFDVADLEWLEEQGDMEEVILHEIGHVLGIGTLWRDRGLLVSPSLPDNHGADTHFKGALAIEAFDAAGGASYSAGAKVPVENRAAPGSGDAHWRESVLDLELMTPFQNVGVPDPLSAITIQSLADLGYVVDESLAESYRLPGAAAAAADHEDNRIDYGDDIMRGPIIVVDDDGRVVRVIPN